MAARSRIRVLDPSIRTRNLGDEIIVRSILEEVPELQGSERVQTHWPPQASQVRQLGTATALVFCGTNVLAPGLWRARQWPAVSVMAPLLHRKVAFLGVGWGAVAPRLDPVTTRLISQSMRRGVAIGVRDTDTLARARSSGLDAEFIGCPTMWSLPAALPKWDGISEVVTTITDYKADPESDWAMLQSLLDRFDAVHFWPQGTRDLAYVTELGLRDRLNVLPASVDAYDEALQGRGYAGTRLHGGIRALQHGCPTLIVSVDQRASTIARDTRLPVIERDGDLGRQIADAIGRQDQPDLEIPRAAAAEWLLQFRASVAARPEA